MSTDESKKIVLGFFENLNAGNAAAALDALSDSATWWIQGTTPISGTRTKAQFIELLGQLSAAIDGGLALRVKGVTAEGDRVAVENTRSLTYYACWTVDERLAESATAVPMAKAYASDIAKNVTSEAIQVHGGIGFTWEHDMHLYHRRALAGEANFGNAPIHRETVAKSLLA